MDAAIEQSVSSVLKIPVESITDLTSQENTPAWDSLAHLLLMLEIESNLGVRFRSQDIPQLRSVAQIREAVAKLKK